MFDLLVGNERAKETLRRMLRQERVPGALLFAGEDGIGKKLFAIELARAFNCRARRGAEACGECSACVRTGKFNLPAADDTDANKQILWSEHRDVGMVRAAGRAIPVSVVRELERETNFRPFEGNSRVFILDGADRLNEASSNALLKTLEEVQPTSHLVLVTSRPASLLPTIRSRCQTIRFSPLAVSDVEKFLIDSRQRAGEEARLAAHLSGGRPGFALELNLDTYRAHRETMLGVVEALAGEADRARLLRAAEELSDARHKDEFEPRLDVLEILIRDLWLLALAPADAKIINYDLRERLSRMAAGIEGRRASQWIARIEELRQQLAVNVNRRVASDALFLAMAAA